MTCTACKSYQKCLTGSCKLDTTSKWDVVAYSAKVDKTLQSSWDTWPANGNPDPYVEMTIGTKKGTSKVQANTWTPLWNEVLIQGVAAGDITNYGMSLIFYDDDAPWDQKMAECKVKVSESVLVSLSGKLSSCADSSGKKHIKDFVMKFVKK